MIEISRTSAKQSNISQRVANRKNYFKNVHMYQQKPPLFQHTYDQWRIHRRDKGCNFPPANIIKIYIIFYIYFK